jgi:diamine N-acetyltransferase
MIKNITMEDQFRDSVDIIRQSFETVAAEFNLTRDNCPDHPSFIMHDDLLALKGKRLNFFGLFADDRQIAFIAVEKANDDLFYIEKLAVLPQHRHLGFGKRLMLCAIEYVKKSRGKKISIGIINEHSILKNWYKNIGFREVTTKNFNHRPFTVCFLEMNL